MTTKRTPATPAPVTDEEYIARVLATFPPCTEEQLDVIAALLRDPT